MGLNFEQTVGSWQKTVKSKEEKTVWREKMSLDLHLWGIFCHRVGDTAKHSPVVPPATWGVLLCFRDLLSSQVKQILDFAAEKIF